MDKVVMKKRLSIFSLLLSTMCCSFLPIQTNAAEATLQAVEQVEIDKFLGVWYEIARKPTSLEKKCRRDITSTYTLNEYGNLQAEQQCVNADQQLIKQMGEAYPVNEPRYSKFKLSFMPEPIRWLPMGQNDYWILKLDQQYQMALIGEPTRQSLWLLSRQPHPNQILVQQYLSYAKSLGYELDNIIYITHQK